MSSEDKIVQKWMDVYGKKGGDSVEYHPERHYNHYGDRGVVDLVITEPLEEKDFPYQNELIEVKSESAVRNATGANEIIRQFNRMKKFYFEDDDHTPAENLFWINDDDEFTYQVQNKAILCFEATEYNRKHVLDNLELYNCVIGESDMGETCVSLLSFIGFAHPEKDTPISTLWPGREYTPERIEEAFTVAMEGDDDE